MEHITQTLTFLQVRLRSWLGGHGLARLREARGVGAAPGGPGLLGSAWRGRSRAGEARRVRRGALNPLLPVDTACPSGLKALPRAQRLPGHPQGRCLSAGPLVADG